MELNSLTYRNDENKERFDQVLLACHLSERYKTVLPHWWFFPDMTCPHAIFAINAKLDGIHSAHQERLKKEAETQRKIEQAMKGDRPVRWK